MDTRTLRDHPAVELVERSGLLAPDFILSGPLYSSQWHLPKISADLAWEVTQGNFSVIIAILDSGVDPSHPDLSAEMVAGYNLYDNNTNTGDVTVTGLKSPGRLRRSAIIHSELCLQPAKA